MSELEECYRKVLAGIPLHVTLVAVSKTRSAAEIQALYDLGQRHFGENKAKELKEKAPALPADIIWHFIGHLQTNKVKHVVPHAQLIHSVDSLRLLEEVNKRAALLNKQQNVLLQIFISNEEQKFGLNEEELEDVLKASVSMKNIRLRGMMGMASFTEDNDQVTAEFKGLSDLFIRMKSKSRTDFDVLSMGMSGDVALAISAGSNMVRVGTSIFGPRSY